MLLNDATFLIVVIFGCLSLIITVVLYKYLESSAEGQGVLLGGTIKYGGALAGFLLINSALLLAYNTLNPAKHETEINIAGKWSIEFLTRFKENGEPVLGDAVITQAEGRREFSINGTTETDRVPSTVAFSSLIAAIHDRKVVFIYENTRNEFGVAQGVLTENEPETFTVTFDDIDDLNGDPKGAIKFSRVIK